VADGTDEDGAWAAAIDEWIVWETAETGEEARTRFPFLFSLHSVRGTTPGPAHSALLRATDL